MIEYVTDERTDERTDGQIKTTMMMMIIHNVQYLIAESKKERNNPMIGVKESQVVFGKPETFPSFGWDVDYGITRVKYVVCLCYSLAISIL